VILTIVIVCFLYATLGKEVVDPVSLPMSLGKGVHLVGSESDMENFGDDLQSYSSMYSDQARV